MTVKLIIELLENGKVNFTGPMAERLLCFGMLKEAENIIIEWNKKYNSGDQSLIGKASS